MGKIFRKRLCMRISDYREIDIECCSRMRLTFYENVSAVILDYFFYDSQSYSCSGILPRGLQAAEHPEHLVGILLLEADAVILEHQLEVFIGA